MRLKLLTGLSALLTLSACLGGAKAPNELLTLTPAERRDPAAPRSAEQGGVITVAVPAVPQALSHRRVPVYVTPTTIQYLESATWVESPNELFRSLLSETLAARTPLVVLDPSVYTQVQGLVLNGQLLSFGLDPTRMEAVAVFEGTLTRPGQSVATNRFEARIPVAEATGAAVAPALNQAANQIAAQVADWIQR